MRWLTNTPINEIVSRFISMTANGKRISIGPPKPGACSVEKLGEMGYVGFYEIDEEIYPGCHIAILGNRTTPDRSYRTSIFTVLAMDMNSPYVLVMQHEKFRMNARVLHLSMEEWDMVVISDEYAKAYFAGIEYNSKTLST